MSKIWKMKTVNAIYRINGFQYYQRITIDNTIKFLTLFPAVNSISFFSFV